MDNKLILTDDGSHSIEIPDWKETYHSKAGAIKEAYHIYINQGFMLFEDNLSILEIGFGTGLNTFITYLEANKMHKNVCYETTEYYPLAFEKIVPLNYPEQLEVPNFRKDFEKIHSLPWNVEHKLSDHFTFKKRKELFEKIQDKNKFDLIYYDPFCERVQPKLWTEFLLLNMYNALKDFGVLVTYASKTSIQKTLQNVGFEVEKLSGPMNKKKMLRATKSNAKHNYNRNKPNTKNLKSLNIDKTAYEISELDSHSSPS